MPEWASVSASFLQFCVVSEPPNYKMKPLRRQVQSTHHVSPYSKQHEAATASANKLQPTSTAESKFTCIYVAS